MKKKIRLKWLTISVFALGAITVLPIVTTACGGDKDDDETTDTGGDEGEVSTDPVKNTDGNYQTYNGNTLEFVGYYGNEENNEIIQDVITAIVNTITPSVDDVANIGDSDIWDLVDTTTNDETGVNTYKYNLSITSEDDIDYAKGFISLSEVWYNQTNDEENDNKLIELSTQLDLDDINYDVLTDWDVSISLSFNSSYSWYNLVYTIAPKDGSNSTTTYQFTLYSYYNFSGKYEVVVDESGTEEQGESGESKEETVAGNLITNPGTTFKYNNVNDDTNLMSFVGKSEGDTVTSMNSVVSAITPGISDVMTDSVTAEDVANGAPVGSGTWLNSGVTSDDANSSNTYSRYTLIIGDDFSYIENFIGVTNWYNEIYNQDLSVVFDITNLNYDVLADWDVSLILNVYTYNSDSDEASYEFVFTIAPKETDTDANTYQFILYTKTDFDENYTDDDATDDDATDDISETANLPITNPVVDHKYQYLEDNFMSFVGYYYNGSNDEGSLDIMNKVVNAINSDVTDVTEDESGTWVNSGVYVEDGHSYARYTLTIDDNDYIKNFIDYVVTEDNGSGWYNQISESKVGNEFDSENDFNYDVLANYDLSLMLNVYSNSSYEFVFTATPNTTDDTDAADTYQFILYTKADFDGKFPEFFSN